MTNTSIPGSTAAAMTVSLMLATEPLILVGNATGAVTLWMPLLLVAVAGLQMLSISVMLRFEEPEGPALSAVLGDAGAATLLLGSRVMFVIVLLPVTLSTAGFMFNETFLYWFPNFGFAFLLLVLCLILVLLGGRVMGVAITVLAAAAAAGLGVLALAGLVMHPAAIKESAQPLLQSDPLTALRWIAPLMLIFLATEVPLLADRTAERGRTLISALSFSTLLLVAWGLVSLRYTGAQLLMETSIPHIKAARAILGEPGHMLMGGAAICAIAASTMTLLYGAGRSVSLMTEGEPRLLPRWMGRGRGGVSALAVWGMALGAAALMGLGMAGEPRLLVYVRGAAALWLMLYGMLHVEAVRCGAWLSLGAAAVYFAAAGVLVYASAEPVRMLVFMAATLAAVAAVVVILRKTIRSEGEL